MADLDHPAGDWLTTIGHNGRFFVIPQFKLVYVSVPKNACTTLKWLMASLAAEDTTRFRSGLRPHTSPFHVVHRRSQFKNVCYPDDLATPDRAEVLPANGWFIFAVIRDPWTRFFSAWQDKVLCRSPIFLQYRNEPWYPVIDFDREQIATSFATFTEFASHPHFPPLSDGHFVPQAEQLRPEIVPYSNLYTLSSMADLVTDLSAHVRQFGWDEPIRLEQSNETSLRASTHVFTDRVRELVERIYEADLALPGAPWSFEESVTEHEWPDSAIREARIRAETGHRLGDMRRIALNFQKQAAEATALAAARAEQADTTIAELRANVAQLEAGVKVATSKAVALADRSALIAATSDYRPITRRIASRLTGTVAARSKRALETARAKLLGLLKP